MSQSHCLVCPAGKALRQGLELDNIKDLTTFFRKMMLERVKLDLKMEKA